MARRGHNEGTIRRRADGRWEAVISLPETGLRKSFYAATKAEAQAKMRAALGDLERGLPLADEQQTLNTYLPQWLDTITPTIRASTLARYRYDVEQNILPTLGRVKLSRLTPQMVQALYAQKLKQGLSPTTVHHLHACFHKALAAAVRLGLVARNVTELVDVPRMASHEVHYLTAEEVRRLLSCATEREDRLVALWTLAIATGMRQGELLALRWRDVSLDQRSIQVRASLALKRQPGPARADGLPSRVAVYTEPKTKRSRRHIRFDAEIAEVLRAHRTRQKVERLAAGAAWQGSDVDARGDTRGDTGLVFCDALGQALTAWHVLGQFHKALAAAGLPRRRFHDLRHTCATLLLLSGVNPKIVSELLGHATVAITLDIYSHVLPDMLEDAAAVMGAILRGETMGEKAI